MEEHQALSKSKGNSRMTSVFRVLVCHLVLFLDISSSVSSFSAIVYEYNYSLLFCSPVLWLSCSLAILFPCIHVLLYSLGLLFFCSLAILFSRFPVFLLPGPVLLLFCSLALLFSCSPVILVACSLALVFSCSPILCSHFVSPIVSSQTLNLPYIPFPFCLIPHPATSLHF